MVRKFFGRPQKHGARAMPEPETRGSGGEAVDLLITGVTIVTMNARGDVLDDAALAIGDGKILAIGPADRLANLADTAGQVLDGAGRLVIPGLVNAHCHGGDSLFRGLVEDLPLEPWLEKLWIAESAILNPHTVELGSTLAYAEAALQGVTSLVDMFWYPDRLVAAAEALGIRVATGGIFFDPPGIDGLNADKRLDKARAFFADHIDHAHLIPAISVHGAYTVGPDNLAQARDLQGETGALLTIHAAETQAEQATIREAYGTSVIRHLDRTGLLNTRSLLAHCVHVDAEEIDILARTGARVAHCPASNLKLGSGIAPVPAMAKAGVTLALGTDGAVSGNDIDMWKAIRLAATLHNGAAQSATAMTGAEALAMATIGGARALGLEDEIGSLEVGKRADLAIIDPYKPHLQPLFDPVTTLAYGVSMGDVTDVFCAGRQIVRDGQLCTVDLNTILAEVSALAPQIRASLEG